MTQTDEILSAYDPRLRAVYDYWCSLPRNPLPARNDFDFTEIPACAPDMALLESHSRDEMIIRLAGTNIVRRATSS